MVSAVNNPSPPTARTRRSEPRTALSKRFSSESSSITIVAGNDDKRRAHHVEPEDRPQLLGEPHQMLHAARWSPATAICRRQASSADAVSDSVYWGTPLSKYLLPASTVIASEGGSNPSLGEKKEWIASSLRSSQ